MFYEFVFGWVNVKTHSVALDDSHLGENCYGGAFKNSAVTHFQSGIGNETQLEDNIFH